MKNKTGKDNGWIWSLFLVVSALFLIMAITFNYCQNQNIWFFILSGIFLGIFYGKNDHRIFHHPFEDEFYDNNDNRKILKDLKVFPGVPPLNLVAQTHNMWVHVVGGLIGAFALYFLYLRISLIYPIIDIYDFGWVDLILFSISALGYSGYIPRILWFFASKGGLDTKF